MSSWRSDCMIRTCSVKLMCIMASDNNIYKTGIRDYISMQFMLRYMAYNMHFSCNVMEPIHNSQLDWF